MTQVTTRLLQKYQQKRRPRRSFQATGRCGENVTLSSAQEATIGKVRSQTGDNSYSDYGG